MGRYPSIRSIDNKPQLPTLWGWCIWGRLWVRACASWSGRSGRGTAPASPATRGSCSDRPEGLLSMMSLWWDFAVVMSLFTSSWSWRVSWCLNCVTWTPTTRNLQISNMISAPFQNSNFWISPVFSLELVCHIHQGGGTRLRNSGKNMTLPCYQFYNVKEMGPEGEYDCKKWKCINLL